MTCPNNDGLRLRCTQPPATRRFGHLAALGAIAALCTVTSVPAEQGASNRPSQYSGMCDASAAVALDAATLIVTDDEKNTLQIYRSDRPLAAPDPPAAPERRPPVRSIPWDRPLGIDPGRDEHPEVDVEGATVLAGRIYWISSHGRNKDGKWRPNRHRFFAMTVTKTRQGWAAQPFGKPCKDLMARLVEDKNMDGLGLAKALGAGTPESEDLAPKRRGLNVEGLCAAADGKSLLIGFRNPLQQERALLVSLHNPAAVLREQAAPQFGDPIELDLRVKVAGKILGLGIRSIEYSRRHGAYLIVAGPHDQRKRFALFRWSGARTDRAKLLPKATAAIGRLWGFTPEALIVYPGKDQVQLLSDDGTLKVKVSSPAECEEGEYQDGECQAKYLLDSRRKTFKSVWVDVE